MDAILEEAYEIIFPSITPWGEDWQIAESILDNFSVRKLGEELAKLCIFRIVNHIDYPDQETTTRIVGRAEGFASELWDVLPDEPHMAQLAYLEYRWQTIR